jgi:ubiquinone/menaquinone biosynthesis C-methylase UbiE
MHDFIRDELDGRSLDAELRTDPAQDTGLSEATADAVVSTLVLCSVPDLDETLAELHRILKPGGTLFFLEHVVASEASWLRWVQDGIAPVWKVLADGCRPNRDTGAALERAGFSAVTYDRFEAPLPVVRPHIVGRAQK